MKPQRAKRCGDFAQLGRARHYALLWLAVALESIAYAGDVGAATATPEHAFGSGAELSGGAGANSGDSAAVDSSVDFDRSLLSGSGRNTTDLSRFERSNPVLPGNYNADIYLNNVWVGRSNVRFAASSAKVSATACVDEVLLGQLGLHPSKISAGMVAKLKDPSACVSIARLIPDASMTFDLSELRLDTSVPQSYLGLMPRGYVSPEYWDAGVAAALLNYDFNSYHSSNHGLNQTTSYLGMNAGLNLGLWQFREDATVVWQSAMARSSATLKWQNTDAYVRRELPSVRAQLTVGDSYTDGGVFDSYGMRGIQLATDDRMLAQSMQGYAPVIHGVAQTNALVTVRQNGVQIYQATVAPGPFTINDLYPTGYGGNLDVVLTEADGRVSNFSVPYASVAQLLRPGVSRFDVAAGQLRNSALRHKPGVLQASVQRGFNNLFTGYAGFQTSQGYAAVLLGGAFNTRYGAVGLDITQANTQIPGYASQEGQSMRITYSKILPATGTSLTVAGYRYSTGGYFGLADASEARDYARRGIDPFENVSPALAAKIDGVAGQSVLDAAELAALNGGTSSDASTASAGVQRKRSSFTLTLNQRLGPGGGSLYANGSISNYWNSAGTNTQFQLGYNNTWQRLSYSVSVTRTRDALSRYDNQYMLNFTVPLGHSSYAPTLAVNLTHDHGSGSQEQAVLNGSLGADNQFSYGATAAHSNEGGDAVSVNGGYRSPYTVLNASYGEGSGYSQASISATGSVIVHPGGVTFGQPIGDTVGIVYVPDAKGARLNSASGARIDGSGYAVVPYLTPYTLNTVQVDPKDLPLDVQLDATSAQTAPYAGAVVMLKFKTESGRTVIFKAHLPNGQALPFGTEVFDEKNTNLGVVGTAGEVLARGVNQRGELTARWHDADGVAQSCVFPYHLAPRGRNAKPVVYEQAEASCVPLSAFTDKARPGKMP